MIIKNVQGNEFNEIKYSETVSQMIKRLKKF